MAIRSTLPPIDFIRMRRSVMAANITEPGPTPDELKIIIEAGLRVPDHSRCGPWRIQIIGKRASFLWVNFTLSYSQPRMRKQMKI